MSQSHWSNNSKKENLWLLLYLFIYFGFSNQLQVDGAEQPQPLGDRHDCNLVSHQFGLIAISLRQAGEG